MRFHAAGVLRLGLAMTLAPLAFAQLIRVEGEGSLEHLENAELAPAFLPGWAQVRFDFRLEDVAGEARALYVPSAATLQIGAEEFALQNAALEVWREPVGAGVHTSYLLRGETGDGWWFSLQNDFAAAGNEQGFPRLLVSPGELVVHDVLLRAGDFAWAGYGDGVITSIEMVPAPEPSAYAWAAAGVLGVSVLLRRCRRGCQRV